VLHADKTRLAVPFKPGVRIDRKQGPLVDCHQSKTTAFSGQAATTMQLLSNNNRRKIRKREMDELVRADELAQRCRDVKSAYSVSEWKKSARKHRGAQVQL
jgi:hypothetical protein